MTCQCSILRYGVDDGRCPTCHLLDPKLIDLYAENLLENIYTSYRGRLKKIKFNNPILDEVTLILKLLIQIQEDADGEHTRGNWSIDYSVSQAPAHPLRVASDPRPRVMGVSSTRIDFYYRNEFHHAYLSIHRKKRSRMQRVMGVFRITQEIGRSSMRLAKDVYKEMELLGVELGLDIVAGAL
jgi:hypothetical protein